jgi:hypothetical protein
MKIRPLATNIPKITWLNWRKVVSSKRGALLGISAKISFIGFPGSVVGGNLNFTQKPFFVGLVLAKGLHCKDH